MQPSIAGLTRRTFVSSSPFFLAGHARPNILILLTDQQSAAAVSAADNRWLRTPAMDSLAARGVSFRQACCSFPRCSPSRSSLWTGRAPHETGVMDNGLPIRSGIPTMGEVFRAAGYTTLYGGKWHLPLSFGAPAGFRQIYKGHSLGGRMDAPLADACIEFLRAKPAEPFLLAASFMNPHDICEWIRRNAQSQPRTGAGPLPPAPANMAVLPDEPEYLRTHRRIYAEKADEVGVSAKWLRDDYRAYLEAYYRAVEAVDRQIGRVLAALEESGLARQTIVVFASDHGEGMGAHGWVEKGAFWEEVIRVPFVIAGPGVAEGTGDPTPVSGMDLLPTLCDCAGIAAPPGVTGLSLRPLLQREKIGRDCIVSELAFPGDASRQGRMVRTRRFKYNCYNVGQDREELFDLERDPGEIHNLARTAEARGALEDHRRLLREWAVRTRDDFPLDPFR